MFIEGVWNIFTAAIALIVGIIICMGAAALAVKLSDYAIAIMEWLDSRKHPDYSGCQIWKFLTK